jgi:hypothetical protein
MRLSEIRAANDLLDDPHKLAARYEHDGCLLVRGALDRTTVATITAEAASALRGGRTSREAALDWRRHGTPRRHRHQRHSRTGRSRDRDRPGRDPLTPVAERVCGHPMHIWRSLYIFAAMPDDPAYVTAPRQDNFAMTATGDYRRLWIALTQIPFADGGLGLAIGSHHHGRLPRRELPEFLDRPAAGRPSSPRPGTSIDPQLVGDHWHRPRNHPSVEGGGAVVIAPPGAPLSWE